MGAFQFQGEMWENREKETEGGESEREHETQSRTDQSGTAEAV
jgi:hypothetical protein